MNVSSRPRRGEVWRAELDPTRGHEQAGTRPVLIVSDDAFNNNAAQLVIAIPLTSKNKRVRSQVPVEPPEGGLRSLSYIKCEDIRSLSLERFQIRMGSVEEETLAQVEYRLRVLLKL